MVSTSQMTQPTPTSTAVAAAQVLVESIAFDHGHLTEEDFSKMDPATRRRVKEAFGKKDALIGYSVVTLAKNLYSKDVRFIFELLQNADDNLFQRANCNGHEPYLVFRVYHDRIIVDCNEDGFKEANLRAICNVGQSSKVGRQGYIGEKGIGFKSVFKVAWKVHIQSGPFSFCFKHRPGDSGMGMISPEWHPAEELPEHITRMTFILHDDGDGDIRTAQRKSIDDEFGQLQPSMMLFLKNIKRIEVRFFDKAKRETKSSVMTRSECDRPNRAVLETVRTSDGSTSKKEVVRSRFNYHLTQGKATGLARNENRTYSPAEEASQAYSTAEIVLAFPLDDSSVPVDQPQNIFAFLPMRHVGFNFLIHSDFVTMANRENIVTSSLRNQGIRRYIASTFVSAVKQMCEHPQLRFQWMRFLPPSTGYHINDSFWSGFVNLLKQQLLGAEIMVPHLGVGLQRTIKQVKEFAKTPAFYDEHGNPLFDDLDGQAAIYISKRYKGTDLDLLRPYGLEPLSIQDMIDRVWADLERGLSKMRYSWTDDDWHSRAAKLLKYPFTSRLSSIIGRIRTMRLLPLDDGKWMSLDESRLPVYFPTTSNGTMIPPGLDIRLIYPNAATHPDRRDFFLTLGVKLATDDHIRSMILQKYQKCWPSLRESIAWIRFLYLTRPEKTESTAGYEDVSIVSSTRGNLEPSEKDVYFPDDKSEYGAAMLGLEVNFLHADYVKDPPVRPGEQVSTAEESWKKWLHNAIGVRERLRLVTSDGSAISDQVLHVAQHLPERFLGLLHHLWPHEGDKVRYSETIRSKFEKIEVLCDGGKKHPLHTTILPTPQLKALSSRFLKADEHLAFLELQQTHWEGKASGWEFLGCLGVLNDDGLVFHLGMLRCIVTKTPNASNFKDSSRLLDLYKAIHGKCIASANLEQARETTRSEFSKIRGIYIPRMGEEDFAAWASPIQCLLNAPVDLEHKFPVDAVYDQIFGKAVADLETVKHFFRDTLAIRMLGWRDYVDELKYRRDEKRSDFALVEAQYKRLKAARLNIGDTKELRKLFRDEALICSRGDEEYPWHTTEECLWSAGAGVQGLVNLSQVYGHDLEAFFVESLQVTRLTVRLVYDELLTLGDKQTTAEHAKQQLLAFSSLLREETLGEAPAPAPLLEKPILPIRHNDGKVLLLPASTGFAIIDRAGPMAQFRDLVKTLDFTMEEVHDLELFIRWAGLGHRYLSRMVEEMPDLGSGEKFRVSEPLYDLKKKAHGLVRVAKYFRSPRFWGNGQALYDLLRDSETWETDDISARLTLTLNGKTHAIKLEQGDVYMSGGDTSPLKIFIPRDEIAQDVCVQYTLPQKLVEWFMINHQDKSRAPINDRAVGVVKGLLNARLASIPRILTQEGIHDIDIESRDADAPDTVVATVVAPQTPSRSRSTSPGTPGRVFTPAPSATLETPTTDPSSSLSPSLFPPAHPAPSRLLFSPEHRPGREAQVSAGVECYRELLGHMIEAGKQTRFLDQGVFGMSQLAGALNGGAGGDVSTAFPSSNFSTFQLGAAGELFVFEMLKSLGSSLPGFCWPNWTSNIKKQVKIHPNYETMEAWGGGAEVSDLQYTDTSGVFTTLLIEKGHLSSAKWAGKRPSYYFEVKSTPRACNEPFYMGGSQYKKMKTLCMEGDTKVYIIFRVFNMFSDKINVKLYVDPAELERRGELDFSTDTYTVKARA
ncbi:hypothetical protein B0T18DRAFT_168089 [Schizothecium vesticola]|uniref:Protein NO VEIN C-terminal domain-containing protein n=1 Tax=Schizothecium vesticola TaxID=314040 RepID=A0AA40ENN5_9PEZI|nr:hypothetical protein B0T18DRAFT_168089 [Schizothecium vesticola]